MPILPPSSLPDRHTFLPPLFPATISLTSHFETLLLFSSCTWVHTSWLGDESCEKKRTFSSDAFIREGKRIPHFSFFSLFPPLPKSALRLPKLPSFFLPPPPLGAPLPSVQLCRQLGESSAFLLSTCLPGCVYGGEGSISCRGFSGSGSEGFAGNFFPLSSRGPWGQGKLWYSYPPRP